MNIYPVLATLSEVHILLALIILPLGIAMTGFWIWMIVDCATKETETGSKIAWLLVIILVVCIGAPLYFFVRKLPRKKPAPVPQ